MSSGTQDVIARLWAQFSSLARDRVGTLAAYLQVASTSNPNGKTAVGGDAPAAASCSASPSHEASDVPPTHAQARQAVHDLIGSLGSYGRPRGSELAAQLEVLLGDGTTPMSAEELAAAHRILEDLNREVAS